MALKVKETVKGFEQNKIKESIEQLQKSTQFAMDSLKNVPGLVVISENDLSKIFSELKEKAKKIKTEEDKKKFFEHYSLVARMCQSYIEAANDWQSIKEAGLTAVSFYFGVDEKSAESKSSAILDSGFIVLGLGPFKKIRDIKKISNVEKIKDLEKTAPNTAKALKQLGEKINEYEKRIDEIIAKEKQFLISLARSSSKYSYTGLKRLDDIKAYFSKPGVIVYFKNCSDPNARKLFVKENIVDKTSLIVRKTDSIEIKRQKELISGLLLEHPPNYDSLIQKFIAAGGTEKEAIAILDQIKIRIQMAGNGIGYMWLKDPNNEIYHEIAHDFRNLFGFLDMFKNMLLESMKR